MAPEDRITENTYIPDTYGSTDRGRMSMGRGDAVRATLARLVGCVGSAAVLGTAALMETAMLVLEATLLLATLVAAVALAMVRAVVAAAETLLAPWISHAAGDGGGGGGGGGNGDPLQTQQRRFEGGLRRPPPHTQTVSPLETRFRALRANEVLRYCQSDSSVVHDPTKRVRCMHSARQRIFLTDESYHAGEEDPS